MRSPGVALMLFASRFDHRRLRKLAPPLVLAALGLCAAVLVVAPQINGASRWLDLGPASFQPSELAKLALLVWAAALSRPQRRRRARSASCGGRSGCSRPSSRR